MKKLIRPVSSVATKPLPTGPHAARLTIFAGLGQRESPWGPKEEVGVGVEVYVQQDGAWNTILVPDVVTPSLSDKSRLYQYVVAILGHVPYECDPKDLLGGPMLVILDNKKGRMNGYFPKIEAVEPITPEVNVPAAQSPLLLFDLDAPDQQIFAQLPNLFKKIVQDSWTQAQVASTPFKTRVFRSTGGLGQGSSGGGTFQQQAPAPAEPGNPFPHYSDPAGGGNLVQQSAATRRGPIANPFEAPSDRLREEESEDSPRSYALTCSDYRSM